MIPDESLKDPELKALVKNNLTLENERLKLALASDQRTAAKILADPSERGAFSFIGDVSESTVHRFITTLDNWAQRNPAAPLEITINSGGGSVVDGLALVDYLLLLRKRGHYITMIGFGMVASMAGAILMAADERVLTSRTYLGLHEVSSLSRGSLTLQEDQMKFAKELQNRVVELLTARSKITKTKLASMWKRQDVYVSAEKALDLGLIDRIEQV